MQLMLDLVIPLLQIDKGSYALQASKGIQGFGCYFPASSGGNFIHCDIGGKRQWGPNGSRTGSYGWQRQTLSGLGWST